MNMRRFSFVTDSLDNEVDESFRNLYPDPKSIEKRCTESVRDRSSLVLTPDIALRYRQQLSNELSFDRSFQEVIEQLPKDYYDVDFDPVVPHLQEISSWDDEDIIEKFMKKIEETDTDKDIIVAELTSMIDANYDDLMSCMRKIQEVSYELKDAATTVITARNSLANADSSLCNSALKIKALSVKKKKMSMTMDTVRNLKEIHFIQGQMLAYSNTGSVGDAAELALQLSSSLKDPVLGSFVAIRSVRHGFLSNMANLRAKNERILNRLCCRKFSTLEYENVLKSYIILDYISSGMSDDENGEEKVTLCFLDSLPKFVNHFQIQDVETCLRAAAAEHFYHSQQRKQRRGSESRSSGSHNGTSSLLNIEDISDFDDIPLNILYKRISAEVIPQCIIRACELMVDILYTDYLIVQWHLSPFDEKNRNVDFLLRRSQGNSVNKNGAPNMSSGDIGALVFPNPVLEFNSETVDNCVRSFLRSQSYAEQYFDESFLRVLASRFVALFSKLHQCKNILWEEMMRSLINILKATDLGDAKLEDFTLMVSSLRSFGQVGRTFCGSPSSALDDFLTETSSTFFLNYHSESFQMLRTMCEAELWQNISASASPEENTVEAVLQALAKDAAKFDEQGMTPTSSTDEAEEVSNPFLSSLKSVRSPLARKKSRILSRRFSVDSNSPDDRQDLSASNKKTRAQNAIVISQSALNGIAKPLFKYLDILGSIPTNSASIVDCMCQLFDYYLCEVFHGFVASDDKSRLLSAPSKMTAPPPHLNREFQVFGLDFCNFTFSVNSSGYATLC
jgi:hypothetical protein